jgi:hypothetical protein
MAVGYVLKMVFGYVLKVDCGYHFKLGNTLKAMNTHNTLNVAPNIRLISRFHINMHPQSGFRRIPLSKSYLRL